MYNSIRHFHAFLDPAYWDERQLVVRRRALIVKIKRMLAEELSHESGGIYGLMAGGMVGDGAPGEYSKVVKRVDSEMRMRLEVKKGEGDRERLLRVIREVSSGIDGSSGQQMDLPGLVRICGDFGNTERKVLDADLCTRLFRADYAPLSLPFAISSVERIYWKSARVTDALIEAVDQVLQKYQHGAGLKLPVSVRALCKLMDVKLAGPLPSQQASASHRIPHLVRFLVIQACYISKILGL